MPRQNISFIKGILKILFILLTLQANLLVIFTQDIPNTITFENKSNEYALLKRGQPPSVTYKFIIIMREIFEIFH